MNEDLRLSEPGASFIKRKERCSRRVGPDAFKPYICPAGVLTVAWGHTNAQGRQFGPDDIWTQAECDAAFEEDMFQVGCHVKALVTVQLTQPQYDMLVSFTENCGWGALAKSTLLIKLNRGDYSGASREFLKWTHGGPEHTEFPGLVSRRHAESYIFRTGDYDDAPGADETEHEMPQAINRPKPIAGSGGGHIAGIGLGGLTLSRVGDLLSAHLDRLNDIKAQVDQLTGGSAVEQIYSTLSNPHVLFWIATLALGWCLYSAYRRAHRENEA